MSRSIAIVSTPFGELWLLDSSSFENECYVNQTAEILLHAVSPFENLEAVVEADGRTVYLYLSGGPEFGTRAVWVRNLVPAPLVFNEDDMRQGLAPVLPRVHLSNPAPQPTPAAEQLSIVWFAEGNGVALFEGEELLAVIPPWSGLSGFHGYARDCAAVNEVCWPLPGEPHLRERIEFSRRYWQEWNQDSPFRRWQPQLLAHYERAFGPLKTYFNINGEHFPPRGLGVFSSDRGLTLATVGMSLCLQPMAEMCVETPGAFRRVELLTRLESGVEGRQIEMVARRMSSLAGLPWREWTWLGDNHTCGWLANEKVPYAGLCSLASCGANPAWMLPDIDGDRVEVLVVFPMTEQKFQEVHSGRSRVADLVKQANFLA